MFVFFYAYLTTEGVIMNVSTFTGFAPQRAEINNYGLSQDKLIEEVRKWEAMASTKDAAENALAIIKAEDRKAEDLSLQSIFIEEDGSIQDMQMTEGALKRLCTLMGVNGATYLLNADPDIRQTCLNREFSKREFALKFHTRNGIGSSREIYSVTSTKFPTAGNTTDVIQTLAKSAADSKATFVYNPNKVSMKFEVFHQVFQNGHYDIGDPHKAGISYLIRDAGFGSIKAIFSTYRHACANMQMLVGENWEMPRIVHRGSLNTFSEKLEETFSLSTKYMDDFLRMNSIAARPEATHSSYGRVPKILQKADYEPLKMFRSLSSFSELRALSPIVEDLNAAWDIEKGHSPSWHGVINSITRVARTCNMDQKLQLESIAGNLLSKVA